MISKTLSISERGQITLPKKLRNLFKTNAVILEILDDTHAVISPIPDIAGKLSGFKKKTDLPFEDIRNMAWMKSSNRDEDK